MDNLFEFLAFAFLAYAFAGIVIGMHLDYNAARRGAPVFSIPQFLGFVFSWGPRFILSELRRRSRP